MVDVSRRGSFERCSAWEGANNLPWGRKGLRAGTGEGHYTV